MRTPRTAAVLAASSLLLVAACGADEPGTGGDGVSVVASTDVYGDIVASIGGDDVDVTSIITGPAADPHSFEASARTQLAVSEADLVVANGGGYDDFMGTLLSATDSGATVIDAVDVSGRAAEAEAAGEQLNEHVWYDVGAVRLVAEEIVSALSAVAPEHAGSYAANGADLDTRLQGLGAAEEAARQRTAGAPVVVTEPVPGYLLDA